MSAPLDRDLTDVGTVMSIRGSVVDVRFSQRLPAINHQLAAGAEARRTSGVLGLSRDPTTTPYFRRWLRIFCNCTITGDLLQAPLTWPS